MKKEIKPYRQNGPTCAIVCMMMILYFYDLIDNYTYNEEMRLYEMYKSKSMGGTPFSALALHLGKNGLKTELYHSENNYFSNEKKLISEYIFNHALEEYKTYIDEANKYGLKSHNGVDINNNFLKEKIDEGNFLIVAGTHENSFHALLIYEYDETGFYLYDPLYTEKLHRSYKAIKHFMNTEIGKWFLSVKSK